MLLKYQYHTTNWNKTIGSRLDRLSIFFFRHAFEYENDEFDIVYGPIKSQIIESQLIIPEKNK